MELKLLVSWVSTLIPKLHVGSLPYLHLLVPEAAAIQQLGWHLACTVDHGSVVLALQCMIHTLVPLGDHNSTQGGVGLHHR